MDAFMREWLLVADFDGHGDFPVYWTTFVGGMPSGQGGVAPTGTVGEERGAGTKALRLAGPAVAEGARISTHHHFDWTAPFWGVRFWARGQGDAPNELLVSLTDIRPQGHGYFSDLRAGRPWQVVRVPLTGQWQQVTVRFEQLAAEGAGQVVPVVGATPADGSELHFIVPENRAYDVWIDDIELACRPGGCASFEP